MYRESGANDNARHSMLLSARSKPRARRNSNGRECSVEQLPSWHNRRLQHAIWGEPRLPARRAGLSSGPVANVLLGTVDRIEPAFASRNPQFISRREVGRRIVEGADRTSTSSAPSTIANTEEPQVAQKWRLSVVCFQLRVSPVIETWSAGQTAKKLPIEPVSLRHARQWQRPRGLAPHRSRTSLDRSCSRQFVFASLNSAPLESACVISARVR